MSRILAGVVSLVVIVTGAGCGNYLGSGNSATTTRTVGSFTGIEVGGLMKATVTIGAQQPITLKGDDNLLPLITTEVEGGILKIDVRDGDNVLPNLPLTLDISTPTLTAVTVSGAGSLTASNVGSQSKMDIRGSGGSTITLNGLTTSTVTLDLSGGSTATLTGSASNLNSTQSGTLNAKDFPVQTATVDLSGSSSGDVTVSSSISGEVSGTSTLRVYGSPPNRSLNVHNGATVTYP